MTFTAAERFEGNGADIPPAVLWLCPDVGGFSRRQEMVVDAGQTLGWVR